MQGAPPKFEDYEEAIQHDFEQRFFNSPEPSPLYCYKCACEFCFCSVPPCMSTIALARQSAKTSTCPSLLYLQQVCVANGSPLSLDKRMRGFLQSSCEVLATNTDPGAPHNNAIVPSGSFAFYFGWHLVAPMSLPLRSDLSFALLERHPIQR